MGERGGDREPVPGDQGSGAEPAPAYAYAGAGVGNFLGGPAGEMKSNAAAGPSCNQGPRGSRETSGPIPKDLKMHIPLWL